MPTSTYANPRKWAGVLVGAAIVYALTVGFGPTQAVVATVFAFTVGLWVTELLPIPITALLSSALLILVARQPERAVLAAYGDPIIPLFIGSFILAKGMEVSGLGERFAYRVLATRGAAQSPFRLIASLALITCSLSLLISNTAVTAMMLPIGLAMLRTVQGQGPASNLGVAVMLILTWGSSVAVGVPVGTPPNLIGISLLEKAGEPRIGFGQWAAFAMPITVLALLGCVALLAGLYLRKPGAYDDPRSIAQQALREKGPLSGAERIVLGAFCTALVLWIVPDACELALGKNHPWTAAVQAALPASVAALVSAALLFVIPNREGPALSWSQASTIDWGTILLFGSGIALGQAMFGSGLAKDLGELAARVSGAQTVWALTALCIALAIILSELASNTAAATTAVPIAIGLSQGAGVSPIPAALGAALGASFGFMLPVSTAPNAIVYSSGLVPSREMLRAGLLLDVVGFAVIWLGLRLFLPLVVPLT